MWELFPLRKERDQFVFINWQKEPELNYTAQSSTWSQWRVVLFVLQISAVLLLEYTFASDYFAKHSPLRRVHLAVIETPPAALSEIINKGHMCLQ